ncbi:MAG: nuclear transport factor 2 family protein [Thermoleophilaceae bacterium]
MIDSEHWLAAWNSADDEQITALCTPDVEVHAVTLSARGRLYRGHDGIREWLNDVRQKFRARSQADALTRLDDDTLVMEGTLYLRSELGAELVEQSFAMLFRLRDERAAWIGTFANATEARDAWKRGIA